MLQIVEQLMAHVHERLDTIYRCTSCAAVFLFESDVERHRTDYGHKDMHTFPL